MTIRLFAAVAIVLLVHGAAPAVQSGDEIVVEITGDLAKEYAKATGATKPDKGLRIEVVATVAQRLPDGQLRIEHSSPRLQQAGAPGLITITATIAPSIVRSEVTPKGTKVYSSPGSKDGKVTTEQTALLHAKLSDLKGLKLRTWKLASEIGE